MSVLYYYYVALHVRILPAHWYTRLPLEPWVLCEDDVNLSAEFEGNIVRSHANTFLCRDCLVFITIIIILYRRYIILLLLLYIIRYTRRRRRRRNIAAAAEQSADTKGPRTLQQLSVYVWITLSQNVLGEKKYRQSPV